MIKVWTMAFISYAMFKRLFSKSFKLGFSSTWTKNFQVPAGFRKGRGTRDQISNIHWIMEKESSRKTSISALLTMSKPLTVQITINCRKFWKRWEYQSTWPASSETCMKVRKQQLELDMEQQTCSKYEKKYVKAVYCHPAYLMPLTYLMLPDESESGEWKSWLKSQHSEN